MLEGLQHMCVGFAFFLIFQPHVVVSWMQRLLYNTNEQEVVLQAKMLGLANGGPGDPDSAAGFLSQVHTRWWLHHTVRCFGPNHCCHRLCAFSSSNDYNTAQQRPSWTESLHDSSSLFTAAAFYDIEPFRFVRDRSPAIVVLLELLCPVACCCWSPKSVCPCQAAGGLAPRADRPAREANIAFATAAIGGLEALTDVQARKYLLGCLCSGTDPYPAAATLSGIPALSVHHGHRAGNRRPARAISSKRRAAAAEPRRLGRAGRAHRSRSKAGRHQH